MRKTIEKTLKNNPMMHLIRLAESFQLIKEMVKPQPLGYLGMIRMETTKPMPSRSAQEVFSVEAVKYHEPGFTQHLKP